MNAVRFGTVYRFETPQAFGKLRAERVKKAIPFAYVSEAMLNDPIGETHKIGGYVINDDFGYPPPDGTPGFAFTATDAMWALPYIGKLKHQIHLYEAYSQPAAYSGRQQLLARALDLKSYAGYDGEPAISSKNVWELNKMIAAMAKDEAVQTAADFKAEITRHRIKPYRA